MVPMDNETMVETFKFLKYYQLATNSLVSKRFRDLIRTHRHKLALLYVNIFMNTFVANQQRPIIKMFNEKLSLEEYNEWIIRNGYSKQIPLEGQIVEKENTENDRAIYALRADVYQNPNTNPNIATNVLYARTQLTDEAWPLFHHLIRLLMDPFVYFRSLSLYSLKGVFSSLAGAMSPDRDRLQCEKLNIGFDGDTQNFIVWVKDHVRCNKMEIYGNSDSNYDQELLEFIMTGAPCTSAIHVGRYDLSKVVVDFVQKFTGLKNCDEYKIVETTLGKIKDDRVVDEVKRNCGELFSEEVEFEEGSGTRQIIGIINNDIDKRLTLNRAYKYLLHVFRRRRSFVYGKLSSFSHSLFPSMKNAVLIPNMVPMDNETMVETFKFLKYYQLATNSLVSKRFRDLIRTHRHKLALLYVNIFMHSYVANEDLVVMNMFNEKLSLEAYNEWIVRNGYSKQIPLEAQIVEKENTENKKYYFGADVYQNPNTNPNIATNVLYARTQLTDEAWPLFHHLIRLLMDPFVYFRSLSLYSLKGVFSSLAGAMSPDRDRLQCEKLNIGFDGDTQNFIVWVKDHVRCNKMEIYGNSDSNYDQELLEFIMTGAPCTSAIHVGRYDLSKVVVDFVQKFTGLKNCDEYKIVETTLGKIKDDRVVDEVKRNCGELFSEEVEFEEGSGTRQIIGIINNDIDKRLTLNVRNFHNRPSSFSIKISYL
ncbi:hypothetical protein DdX_11778 [Ditylenchus destructor]|uniref:F-box domain-containing protein n=1 Tax=Ditylenchus destructor TaxID=166010 RepID=A0AAD4MXQ0_9BILA|nr:hypothetical protein DdX_11778 [Ditylenchus destructor]